MILKIPFHDEFAIFVDVNMSWRVISDPSDENVVATPNLAHSQMLPCRVTEVKTEAKDNAFRPTF